MTRTRDARMADTNASAPTTEAEGIAAASPKTAAPAPPKRIARIYERFLEMPVWVVLAVMWVVGAIFLGSSALALWVVGSLVVRAMVGSF